MIFSHSLCLRKHEARKLALTERGATQTHRNTQRKIKSKSKKEKKKRGRADTCRTRHGHVFEVREKNKVMGGEKVAVELPGDEENTAIGEKGCIFALIFFLKVPRNIRKRRWRPLQKHRSFRCPVPREQYRSMHTLRKSTVLASETLENLHSNNGGDQDVHERAYLLKFDQIYRKSSPPDCRC